MRWYLITILALVFLTGCLTNVDPNDSCSALKGAAKDNCYSEQLKCSKISSDVVRDSCVAELAQAKGDIKVCLLIEDTATKGFCQHTLADTVEVCRNIENTYWYENCMYQFGISENSYEHCWEISNDELRHECVRTVALELKSVEGCQYLPNKVGLKKINKRAECLFQLALSTNNLAICDDMGTRKNKDVCKLRFAKLRSDQLICDGINSTVIRETCEKHFV